MSRKQKLRNLVSSYAFLKIIVGIKQSCKKATGMRVSPMRKVAIWAVSEEGFMSTHYIMYPKH